MNFELKKIDVPILAVVVVVGALLRKEYLAAGHWLTIAALVYYVLANLAFFIGNVKNPGLASVQTKVRLVIFPAFIYIIVNGIINMTVSYFAVLVLFAIDYLLSDIKNKGE